jgi:methylmalonyl-CoA/ethylmalonyl-CoA epimerase
LRAWETESGADRQEVHLIGRLNHVAIAVRNMDAAVEVYRQTLGAAVSEKVAQPEHGVSTVFITLPNTKIELLEPLGANSPIAKFLERSPDGGIHHICYEVDDIIAARDRVRRKERGCWATVSRGSVRTASPCCSCIRRISAVRSSSSSRLEHADGCLK